MPFLGRLLEDRLVFMPAAPRAIDQNRDRAQPACCRDNSLAGLGRIERERQRLCTGLPRQRLKALLVAPYGENACPAPAEEFRRRLADPAAGAGDDGDPTLKRLSVARRHARSTLSLPRDG
jgi:hypothetical protein